MLARAIAFGAACGRGDPIQLDSLLGSGNVRPLPRPAEGLELSLPQLLMLLLALVFARCCCVYPVANVAGLLRMCTQRMHQRLLCIHILSSPQGEAQVNHELLFNHA